MSGFRPPDLVRREERLEPHEPSVGSSGMTTATAAASSRECVIESSIWPAPIRVGIPAAVRPLRCTPGFGRPWISISFQVKYTPQPSALPTASLAANRPA